MSQVSGMVLTFYWITAPINAYWMFFGPITSDTVFWIRMLAYVRRIFGLAIYGIEVCYYKYMTIVVLKQILPIVDNFAANYSLMCNMLLVLTLAMVYSFSGRPLQFKASLRSLPPFVAESTPVAPM